MSTVNRRPRRRFSQAERAQMQRESLERAAGGISLANYPAIIAGFVARGLPEESIAPRENVFTFNAWKALGRYVRKGEKGVAVTSWVASKRADDETPAVEGEEPKPAKLRAVTAYVFHVSQTEAAEGGAA